MTENDEPSTVSVEPSEQQLERQHVQQIRELTRLIVNESHVERDQLDRVVAKIWQMIDSGDARISLLTTLVETLNIRGQHSLKIQRLLETVIRSKQQHPTLMLSLNFSSPEDKKKFLHDL